MRYGIFGDVHSNLEAFEEVIKAYKKERIDRYLCVGDIVGYGADPVGCIENLKILKADSVCGNHDWASVGLFDIEYFNPTAKRAIEWTKKFIDDTGKVFLRSLDLILKEGNIILAHGTLHRPEEFLYLLDLTDAQYSFDLMDRQILFIGHTHTPVIFFKKNNTIDYTFKDCLDIEEETRYIINVGSVGQPRDGDPRAAYCVYDTEGKRVWIKRIEYDIEKAEEKILKAGLPAVLGYRLLEGR